MSNCTKCGGKGYVEVHQPGHTHYETDAGEGCPVWHFERVPCTCNRIGELERERDALRAALTEARCWIVDGTRRTPEQRGAKCETAIDAREIIDAALEQPAAQSSERAE